ncbi:MAG: ribbon-helix-helix protein, CopG family [Defluviitaleaceae bacterium]|nr:ribbon-helix-helix protein, CopG family [Defluviitaleaceae bacterium]MCL2240869.1 ribbon-helix-helix protein, CopG family [Defluviitaleaceae bacterium]
MKTEKVSVNLSPAELGQIDLLVARGVFDNRSDFMRAAARKTLEGYADSFKQFLEPEHLKEESTSALHRAIGISFLDQNEIAHMLAKGKKMHIRVIGLLNIAKSITPEQIKETILSCKVYGKLSASDEVKAILLELGK